MKLRHSGALTAGLTENTPVVYLPVCVQQGAKNGRPASLCILYVCSFVCRPSSFVLWHWRSVLVRHGWLRDDSYWCFTPRQPVQLPRGKVGEAAAVRVHVELGEEDERVGCSLPASRFSLVHDRDASDVKHVPSIVHRDNSGNDFRIRGRVGCEAGESRASCVKSVVGGTSGSQGTEKIHRSNMTTLSRKNELICKHRNKPVSQQANKHSKCVNMSVEERKLVYAEKQS